MTKTNTSVTIPNNIESSSLTTAWSTQTTATTIQTARVRITDQDIEFDGVGLRETLQGLQKRLAVLVPNPKLEKEWSELKDLANRYRELEIELLEKSRVWNTLKSTDTK